MSNSRAVAAAAFVVLVVGVVIALLLDRGPAEVPVAGPTGPRVTAEPVASEEATPAPEPAEDPAPVEEVVAEPEEWEVVEEHDHDHGAIGGLDATLEQPDRDAAWDAAIEVVTALTAQDPAEDRAARLGPFFTPGARAVGGEGPAPFGSVVRPKVLNWVKPFEPEDEQVLGLLVNIHYEVVREGADGYGAFGVGDAEWFVYMVKDASGRWVAAEAELSASTDS